MAKALINFAEPEKSSSGGGGFKAGNIKITNPRFEVYKDQEREGKEGETEAQKQQREAQNKRIAESKAVTALMFDGIRLDEDLQEIVDEASGEAIPEKMKFSLGGKSLASIHPANGSSADDGDPDDAGSEVGATGNTTFLVEGSSFTIHEKSSFYKLQHSMEEAGYKGDAFDKMWAPALDGMVVYMESQADEEMQMEKRGGKIDPKTGKPETEALRYKVVKTIVSEGKAGKKKKSDPVAAAKEKTDAKKSDAKTKPAPAAEAKPEEAIAINILKKLSEKNDGQTITRKLLSQQVGEKLLKDKVESKFHVLVGNLIKNKEWLKANEAKFDAVYDADENEIKFGAGEAAAEDDE